MSDFSVTKRVDIFHCDGWGVRLEDTGEEFTRFRLAYVEDIDSKGEKEIAQIALWPEQARLLVNALAKMLDEDDTTSTIRLVEVAK